MVGKAGGIDCHLEGQVIDLPEAPMRIDITISVIYIYSRREIY